MKIICWNIQKLNITKAAGRRGDIASAVAAAANGEPFILFVLEARQNAQNALGVANHIRQALQAAPHNIPNINVGRVDIGGNANRREDILVVAGNGATFVNNGAYTDWHNAFDLSCRNQVISAQAREAARTQRNNQLRETGPRVKRAKIFEELMTLPATAFRNPANLTIGDGTNNYRALVLHSPGPADGENYSDTTYAPYYNQAVLSSAVVNGFQIVMGDFNQHGDINTTLRDCTKGYGGTTKKHDGTASVHRYDRVFTNLPVQVTVGTDSLADRTLTDHLFTVTTVPLVPFVFPSINPNVFAFNAVQSIRNRNTRRRRKKRK